jgi:hypothetical protein
VVFEEIFWDAFKCEKARFWWEPGLGFSADLRMAYLLVILCKIWRDFLCGGMEIAIPPIARYYCAMNGAPFVLLVRAKGKNNPGSPSTGFLSMGWNCRSFDFAQDDKAWWWRFDPTSEFTERNCS